MAWEFIFWAICFAICMALLGLLVWQLISLSDLEFDYINPYDSSSKINACVLPEFLIQGGLTVFFLVTWHWLMFLLSAPVTYYHYTLYSKRKHLLDVTEIFRLLHQEKKYRLVKLGFYMTIFFIVMFRVIASGVVALIDSPR